MKLLCLPYAGGTAQVFKNLFQEHLDPSIEIIPIELPGRGRRFSDSLKTEFNELFDDVIQYVLEEIKDGSDYALFGYSMGSRVVFEIYNYIIKHDLKVPKTIFFCAAKPPEFPYVDKNLDRNSIIKEMRELGGTQEEVLNNEQLMDIFVPIMRADLQVLISYKYELPDEKIHVPIVVMYGEKDYDILSYVENWGEYTESTCEFITYNAGHFFINEYYKEVTNEINLKLLN